jgi:Uma2 family endonuclease
MPVSPWRKPEGVIMVFQTKPATFQEFEAFIQQPENADKLFELIHGEIGEVSPGRTYYSGIGIIVATAVRSYCREHELPCYISGEAGAYYIDGHVVVPVFAYKQTPLSEEYPDPAPPLWVVEVISPTDKANDVRNKRQIYLDAGILYWETYPKSQRVDVYAPNLAMQTVGVDGILTGGNVLPGFSLSVRELLSE